jgi:8-oxo-dGTP pyrophosphatase MutT (NUDIX family)
MLDLDTTREGPTPRDSATLIVARDRRDRPGEGIEVFFVERHKTGFLGGAVVFPGGKLDPSDLDLAWASCTTPPVVPAPERGAPIATDAATLRALAIAAAREALEEAAIVPVVGPAPAAHADLLAWRAEMKGKPDALRGILEARGLRLDLASLHPLARWITPVAESRRFDTRFFLFAPRGEITGAHDDHETTASFWATPADVLARYESRALVLAPPTHRTLQVLSQARDAGEAVAIATRSCLDPICPKAVPHRDAAGETIAIVLPGDPEHGVPVARVPGASRYVLRGGRFVPEGAPDR